MAGSFNVRSSRDDGGGFLWALKGVGKEKEKEKERDDEEAATSVADVIMSNEEAKAAAGGWVGREVRDLSPATTPRHHRSSSFSSMNGDGDISGAAGGAREELVRMSLSNDFFFAQKQLQQEVR